MEKRRDVFQAIADPTRREIIHLVSRQPLNLNAIAGYFDSSRPTISQHVKVLTECGLIIIRKEGRERYCEARLEKLSAVSDWVAQYQQYWNDTIDSMENYITDLQTKKQDHATRKNTKRNSPRK